MARGQGLSPLSSVGHLSTLLSVDHPSIRNERKFSTREPEPIPVMLYDYAHHIILFSHIIHLLSPLLFSPWKHLDSTNYTRQGWTCSPCFPFHEIRSNDVSRPSRYICINCLERGEGEEDGGRKVE